MILLPLIFWKMKKSSSMIRYFILLTRKSIRNIIKNFRISFQDGFFEGNVSVTDDNDMLFLSVPYNVQWEISVDGEPADVIRLCSGAFTGVKLSKGEHKIVAAYRQKFLEKSILLSCVSIILITVLFFRRK